MNAASQAAPVSVVRMVCGVNVVFMAPPASKTQRRRLSVAGKRPAAGGHVPVNHWQPRYLCAFLRRRPEALRPRLSTGLPLQIRKPAPRAAACPDFSLSRA
jgi:hypothetical protein